MAQAVKAIGRNGTISVYDFVCLPPGRYMLVRSIPLEVAICITHKQKFTACTPLVLLP